MMASIIESHTTLWQRLIWQLFPVRCLVCMAAGEAQRDLCSGCAQDLPWLEHSCQRCAEPLSQSALCGRCQQQTPAFDSTIAPFIYASPVADMIHRFKFQRQLVAGRLLAELMADKFAAADRPDSLVAVPLHRKRAAERGFNQSFELAKVLAKRLSLPLEYDLVRRVRDTPQQVGLIKSERQKNLRGAFVVRRSPPRHIAIIDDVMTTGSTVNEVAQVLRAGGAERIQVWVCARTAP